MKTLGLYYIFDNLGETVVGQPVFFPNDLIGAIAFRDTFITNKETKYNYKALDLVCVGRLKVDEDGCVEMDPKLIQKSRLTGSEILSFISAKSAELGIDDDFVEEENN